ncbi:uncharacterized protein PAC_19102 [Phialocephala subalpina]|uniref:Heme haloperoxidase family profile domain-containing protein n=1 Tax=Phialocephala subalpina TaxID=576137 RepID=A0A1L7XVW9_9HELO|nr:uncharacterized protein PAC_19102 [Phialocephala subalpina]
MRSPTYILPLLGLGVYAFSNMSPEYLAFLKNKVEGRGGSLPDVPSPTKTKRQFAIGTSAAESNCGPLPCTSASQIRGPCPGFNAAANYNYLDRSGVTTLENTITGLGQAYGMSVDLAAFLAAYAIAQDGDLQRIQSVKLSGVIILEQEEKTRSYSELIAGIAIKLKAIRANFGQ